MTTDAIRARAALILDAGLAGTLEHFNVYPDRLDAAADYVLETTRSAYPDLDIPYHARWRHFVVDGHDRWRDVADTIEPEERGRAAFDLVVTSVLLDAGAGDAWSYKDARSGRTIARSEGLAVASLDAFASGLFSSDRVNPLRADAQALERLSASDLGAAFQVSNDNPLDGLEGRTGLINALGAALTAHPEIFGTDPPQVGGLFDHLAGLSAGTDLAATQILDAVLSGFGSIWPGRTVLGGRNLGDTWRHPAAVTDDPASGLVPFHKLSQWLSYSLAEPLEDAGLTVTGMDRLTALAEYRNGGLLVDLGVLEPKHDDATGKAHAPGDELIVEWRALTVALIAKLADRLRARLDMSAQDLPLAKVLQGGTWSAGRRIAQEKRAGAGPPIRIISDGSVF